MQGRRILLYLYLETLNENSFSSYLFFRFRLFFPQNVKTRQ